MCIRDRSLVSVKPITDNQKLIFDTWDKGKNQFLFGAAGTGKTFVSLYLALQDVMDLKKPYDKVVLVRSLIPTREIGFLPGDEEDKAALYQVPYQNMVQFMFEMQNEQQFNNLYDRLKGQGTLYFLSTSFLRGLTFDNSIIIVDECQNLNFHELDTIITRVGQDSKIVFCGDFDQTDLIKQNERNGLHDFLRILEEMEEFNCTEFTIGDMGKGECAGEVVPLAYFELSGCERELFEAHIHHDERDHEKAYKTAFNSMLHAAKALVKSQWLDVPEDQSVIVKEFRTRFVDTELFFDTYAKDKFARYLLRMHETPPVEYTEDISFRSIEEAGLFIEATYACYDRNSETEITA